MFEDNDFIFVILLYFYYTFTQLFSTNGPGRWPFFFLIIKSGS